MQVTCAAREQLTHLASLFTVDIYSARRASYEPQIETTEKEEGSTVLLGSSRHVPVREQNIYRVVTASQGTLQQPTVQTQCPSLISSNWYLEFRQPSLSDGIRP
jgi:hypothetical protein